MKGYDEIDGFENHLKRGQDVMSETNTERGRILVVGLGNELLTDDGVGVHSARRLEEALGGRALVAEVGTAVLNALHLFEAAERILAIDAMQAGGAPGTVYTFTPKEVEQSDQQLSIHELNLVGALRFLPAEHRKKTIRIIGVEPQTIEFGMELTEAVAAALPSVVATALGIVEEWEKELDGE